MLKTIIALLAAGSVAKITPINVNYVTIVPENQTNFVAGSKPTIKVTLSQAVASSTNVTLTSSNPSAIASTVVNIPIGQRVGTVQVPVLSVLTDTNVKFTGVLNTSQADSRTISCLHSRILRWSFVDEDASNPVNTVGHNDNFVFKITLSGPAPTGGMTWAVTSVTGPLNTVLSGASGTVGAGNGTDRGPFPVFVPTGGGSITVTCGDGSTFTDTYTVN